MNKKRETEMELLAFEVDDFQQTVLSKIKAILKEEEMANDGMQKMPVSFWGNSAIDNQIEKSNISVDGLKEAIEIIDKNLTEVYHILMGTYV